MFIYQIISNTWYCRTLVIMQVSKQYYPVTSEWAFQNCNVLAPTSIRFTADEFGSLCDLTGRFKCGNFSDFQLCESEYSPKPLLLALSTYVSSYTESFSSNRSCMSCSVLFFKWHKLAPSLQYHRCWKSPCKYSASRMCKKDDKLNNDRTKLTD